jgi:hypothetical protein
MWSIIIVIYYYYFVLEITFEKYDEIQFGLHVK